MPTTPAGTLLFIIGPDVVDDNYADDYAAAVVQLATLGYVPIDPRPIAAHERAAVLAKCHGMATTPRFDDLKSGANMRLLEVGHALGKPELSVAGWARGTAPDAAAWFHELFDGAL